MPQPFLSIAIPTYNRMVELRHSLDILVEQISQGYANEVELHVVDDFSTDDTEAMVREYATRHDFITYRRYPQNIGLERNLIACGRECTGEYLWLFGDDDFLETPDALATIIETLREEQLTHLVLNRTRRSFDLSKLMTHNWMGIDPGGDRYYDGLREFCLDWGLLSVVGFITVNIFKREPFYAVDDQKYYGVMYPQLGMMLEAFHDAPCKLLARPLICHRTQTAEEKAAAFAKKTSERDFMVDVDRRNATYFGFRLIEFLEHLRAVGAFSYSDIDAIEENTVIFGPLRDFICNNIELAVRFGLEIPGEDWERASAFLPAFSYSEEQQHRLSRFAGITAFERAPAASAQDLTFSVITPSYNQADYLSECLDSVWGQTHPPIEHLVFDPGSTDASRRIASSYAHVSLIAEPDEGQGDAVAKGFARATGDILAWVNSDDYYFDPSVFEKVAARFAEADQPDIVYGRGVFVDERGEPLRDAYVNRNPTSLPDRLQHEDGILQPSVFIRRTSAERVGEIAKNLEFCMDYEYWIRSVAAGLRFVFLDDDLSKARYHLENKTYGQRAKSYAQVAEMVREQFGYVHHLWLRRYAEFNVEGLDGVLAHGGNSNMCEEAVHREHLRLLRAYNTDADTVQRFGERADEKGMGDTLGFMRKAGLVRMTCREIPMAQSGVPGNVCYNVGGRRWAYNAEWKKQQIARSHRYIREARRLRRSDTCVIVCNGPSLNLTDFDLLAEQDLIVSNNIFLSEEVMRHATYYTVVNYLVAEQSGPSINLLDGVSKILPYWLSYCLHPGRNVFFMDAVGFPEFSTDIFKNLSWRHTVTFYNMQVAYGLGYKKALLIGCDHSYRQAPGVKEQEVICDQTDDVNHFDPSYFKGKRWQAADVDMMEEMYRLAKQAFEADGREIVNCTAGGHLELFRRANLADELSHRPKRIWSTLPTLGSGAPGLLGISPREAQASLNEVDLVSAIIGEKLVGDPLRVVIADDPDHDVADGLDSVDILEVDTECADLAVLMGLPWDKGAPRAILCSFDEEKTAAVGYDFHRVARYLADRGYHVLVSEWHPIAAHGREHDWRRMVSYPCDLTDRLAWGKIIALRSAPDDERVSEHLTRSLAQGKSERIQREARVKAQRATEREPKAPPAAAAEAVRRRPTPKSRAPKSEIALAPIDAGPTAQAAAPQPTAVQKPKPVPTPREAAMSQPTKLSLLTRGTALIGRVLRLYTRWPGVVVAAAIACAAAAFFDTPYPWAFAGGSIALLGVLLAYALTRALHEQDVATRKLRGELVKRINDGVAKTDQKLRAMTREQLQAQANNMEERWRAQLEALEVELQRELDAMHQRSQAEIRKELTQWQKDRQNVYGLEKKIVANVHQRSEARLAELERALEGAQTQRLELWQTQLDERYFEMQRQLERRHDEAAAHIETRLRETRELQEQRLTEARNYHDQRLTELEGLHDSQLKNLSHRQDELLSVANDKAATALNQARDAMNICELATAGINGDVKIVDPEERRERIDTLISRNTHLNAALYQPFSRQLRGEDIWRLRERWLATLGLNLGHQVLGYLAHRICRVEDSCSGRLAGNVQDALVRVLTALAVGGESLSVLEIGTLFGINLAVLHETCRGYYEKIHLTAIDPLDGYYGNDNYDQVTRVPVTPDVFSHNLARLHVPNSDVTLIRKLSTEPSALKAAGKRTYDLLIIDGDHSLDGVKADYDSYHGLVKPGGFIIFDDYGSDEWPAIKAFVDREVLPQPDIQRVGADWRTLVVRTGTPSSGD